MCSSCSNWFGFTSCQHTTANQNSSFIIPIKNVCTDHFVVWSRVDFYALQPLLFPGEKVLRIPLKSLTDWCRIKLTAYLYCQISSPIQYGIIKWLQYLLFRGSTHACLLPYVRGSRTPLSLRVSKTSYGLLQPANEVVGRLCFYRCLWFCPQGGGHAWLSGG